MDKDINFKSYADVSDLEIVGEVFAPDNKGSNIDDILKVSHSHNLTFENCVVLGGEQSENALDLNRECYNVLFKKMKLVAGRQNAITIKGGCEYIRFKDVEIVPGGNCDIELGNFSHQSYRKVKAIYFNNVYRSDGAPVRLRVGHSDYPTIENSNFKYQILESHIVKTYVFFNQLITKKK